MEYRILISVSEGVPVIHVAGALREDGVRALDDALRIVAAPPILHLGDLLRLSGAAEDYLRGLVERGVACRGVKPWLALRLGLAGDP